MGPNDIRFLHLARKQHHDDDYILRLVLTRALACSLEMCLSEACQPPLSFKPPFEESLPHPVVPPPGFNQFSHCVALKGPYSANHI